MFKALSLGGLTAKELATRVWAEMQEDEVLGRSAQLSYYFLLALFPLLLFLTSVIGIIIGSGTGMRHALFDYLSQVLPGSASKLVSETMLEVSTNSGGGKVSFGILAALWAASNGMGAVSESLNVAYDVKEERPWWKVRLTTIGLTLALALLIISALVLVLFGHDIGEAVAGRFGLGTAFEFGWKVLQWPVVLIFVLLAFALIYYFAPDVHDADWKWITPGAIIGVVLWLLVSFGFKTYLEFFDSYSATYGSLGAVIVLMLWFYFTGAAILIGGEINSEIENAMAKQGAPDAKEKGEKAPDDKTGKAGREGRAAGDGRAVASQATGGSGRAARATATPARTSQTRGKSGAERSFSIGKLFVVLGAWGLGKVRRGQPRR
ncbi:MAG TPA: YihY/virulence factor BrkB family protein [Pyrinomonadaceae bacterium]|nr:YihY/virulence factor BrkB family protein [Pyrinomonadaceae bacterium]